MLLLAVADDDTGETERFASRPRTNAAIRWHLEHPGSDAWQAYCSAEPSAEPIITDGSGNIDTRTDSSANTDNVESGL